MRVVGNLVGVNNEILRKVGRKVCHVGGVSEVILPTRKECDRSCKGAQIIARRLAGAIVLGMVRKPIVPTYECLCVGRQTFLFSWAVR